MDLQQLIQAARPYVTGLMTKPGAFARSAMTKAGPIGAATSLYDTLQPTPANANEPGGASWSTPMRASDIPGDSFAQRFHFPAMGALPQAPSPQPPVPMGDPGVAPKSNNNVPAPPAPTPPPNFGGITGQNPNIGNMADPSQLGDPAQLQARQVMDQSSGQMVNDFYKKPWKVFDAPGQTDQPMLKKFLSLIGAG